MDTQYKAICRRCNSSVDAYNHTLRECERTQQDAAIHAWKKRGGPWQESMDRAMKNQLNQQDKGM